jgi:hypothetical protein
MSAIFVTIFIVMCVASRASRRLALALIPFALFGISYDLLRLVPNFTVSPVDTCGLYELEKALFGITSGGERITLCEYFASHHCMWADVLAGAFYLCWVPVPLAFGVVLYFQRRREVFLRFSLAFLTVNILGFIVYYLHPAAPPWYVADHGCEVILGTPASVAGLARFDQLTGTGIFRALYGQNSNVFAAIPSLHAAYMVVALWYALQNKSARYVTILFVLIMLGIWWTAVYTTHHYVIDVLLGIMTAIAGIILVEWLISKVPKIRRLFLSYVRRIS